METLPRTRINGPLSGYVEGIYEHMRSEGYARLSTAHTLNMVSHLSRWMLKQELEIGELHEGWIRQFLEHRRAVGYTHYFSWRAMKPVLRALEMVGLTIPSAPAGDTELERVVDRFRKYLTEERQLTNGANAAYCDMATCFLSEHSGEGGLEIEALTAAAVTSFIVRGVKREPVSRSKFKVTALRALLRYLHICGDLAIDLVPCVPAVAGWRQSSLPLGFEPGEVKQLLCSCDRRKSAGRRDYAVLLLLVRLGLRAGEVAALELDDIHWAEGELSITGKGRKTCRLPLPHDVGEAIVGYLRRGRPRQDRRRVFLHTRAPYTGLESAGISAIVTAAIARAGLRPPRRGAHVLRHTAATQMLRSGGSLTEIAQVLRHESIDTTALYAKVDRQPLRELARAWPRGDA